MKKIISVISLLLVLVLVSSCSFNQISTINNSSSLIETDSNQTWENTTNTSETTSFISTNNPDPEIENNENNLDFSITSENLVSSSNNIYTITEAGTYTISGVLNDGQIIIDASSESKVKLILSNVEISCSFDAPILCKSADKLTINVDNDTYNVVKDTRTSVDQENNYDGCIYADCDMEINGNGILIVNSQVDNGIKTKDDLEIKNLTLKVTAQNVALKGNDSIEIKSGTITLISKDGDGMKTSNSSLSSKNKQKGIISITGGYIDIYASNDGISAAYDVIIEGEDTKINIYTGKYANVDLNNNSSELYLILSTSIYNENYDYYIFQYNDSASDGKWVKFDFETYVSSGKTKYCGLVGNISSSYSNFVINIVNKGQQPDGKTYLYSSDNIILNTNMNAYVLSISNNTITGSWSKLSKNSNNSDKTTYSTKGIKAENSITIENGVISISASDDGIHTNSDLLETNVYGTGDITINSGSIQITSSDDGIHADNILNINGGYINIIESYEGLEGNVININNGSVYVYSKDDGINAKKGSSTPLVNITGGYIDITTPQGDTDGIDSNGNITISGGFTIVKSGSSQGNMAGSIDLDGTITVTGGDVIAIGGICETPNSNSVPTYVSSNTQLKAGNYVLKDKSNNELLKFTLNNSYSSIWISSSKIAVNNSYTLSCDNSTVLSWTQSQTVVGASNNQWGPGGGRPGGFPF